MSDSLILNRHRVLCDAERQRAEMFIYKKRVVAYLKQGKGHPSAELGDSWCRMLERMSDSDILAEYYGEARI